MLEEAQHEEAVASPLVHQPFSGPPGPSALAGLIDGCQGGGYVTISISKEDRLKVAQQLPGRGLVSWEIPIRAGNVEGQRISTDSLVDIAAMNLLRRVQG